MTVSTPLALWSAKSLVLLVWDHPEASPLDLGLDVRVLGVMAVLVCAVAVCVSLLPASRVWSSNLILVLAAELWRFVVFVAVVVSPARPSPLRALRDLRGQN